LGTREERHGGKNGQPDQAAGKVQVRPDDIKRDGRLIEAEDQ